MLAKTRCARVTLISGDVHLCGVGRLYSQHKKRREGDPRKDYRLMYQIVCSAIGNPPPPDGLVKALHWMTKAHKTNEFTRDKMIRGFHDVKGKARLCNRRNWCEVWEIPSLPGGAGGGGGAGGAASGAGGASLSGGGGGDAIGASALAPSPAASTVGTGVGQHHPQPPSVERLRWPMACHLDARLHAAPGDLVFALRVERFEKAPVVDGRIAEYQFVVPELARPARRSAAGKYGHPSQNADLFAQKGWSRRYAPEEAGPAPPAKRPAGAAVSAVAASALQGVRRAPRTPPAAAGAAPGAAFPASTSAAAAGGAVGTATF